METFSALLAICAENSSIPGEFPAQRPVTRSFGVFFDLCLNKRLINNREVGDLRRHHPHYDVIVMQGKTLELWTHVSEMKIKGMGKQTHHVNPLYIDDKILQNKTQHDRAYNARDILWY